MTFNRPVVMNKVTIVESTTMTEQNAILPSSSAVEEYYGLLFKGSYRTVSVILKARSQLTVRLRAAKQVEAAENQLAHSQLCFLS